MANKKKEAIDLADRLNKGYDELNDYLKEYANMLDEELNKVGKKEDE